MDPNIVINDNLVPWRQHPPHPIAAGRARGRRHPQGFHYLIQINLYTILHIRYGINYKLYYIAYVLAAFETHARRIRDASVNHAWRIRDAWSRMRDSCAMTPVWLICLFVILPYILHYRTFFNYLLYYRIFVILPYILYYRTFLLPYIFNITVTHRSNSPARRSAFPDTQKSQRPSILYKAIKETYYRAKRDLAFPDTQKSQRPSILYKATTQRFLRRSARPSCSMYLTLPR